MLSSTQATDPRVRDAASSVTTWLRLQDHMFAGTVPTGRCCFTLPGLLDLPRYPPG